MNNTCHLRRIQCDSLETDTGCPFFYVQFTSHTRTRVQIIQRFDLHKNRKDEGTWQVNHVLTTWGTNSRLSAKCVKDIMEEKSPVDRLFTGRDQAYSV